MTNFLLLAAAVIAQPFSFGNLSPEQEVTFATDGLRQCAGSEAKGYCALSRDTFGGVKIDYSLVAIRDRHIATIFIRGASYQFDEAVDALKAKFGAPSQVDNLASHRASGGQVVVFNWYFVNGVLTVSRDGDEPTFLFAFASNRKTVPKVDF